MFHNLDAEKAAIGSMLVDGEQRKEYRVSLIPGEHFYSEKHQIIADAVFELDEKRLPVNAASVAAELENKGLLEKAGNGSYIASLFDNYYEPNSDHIIKLLKDAAFKRQLEKRGYALYKLGRQKDITPDEAFKRAGQHLLKLKGQDHRNDFPPLSKDQTQVKQILTQRPAPAEFIIYFRDDGLALKGTVGLLIATGGTGKTRFLIQISLAAARGQPWADFSFDSPLKVLLLVAEEPQDELNRRLWDACDGDFPEYLYAKSVKGRIGPLMKRTANGVEKTEHWYWLDETIKKHSGLDLLILDPKSRLYGLDENSNDDNTQWVASLEELSERHGVTIFFDHHTPKDTKSLSQWMARGGGGLVDACRFAVGMMPCSESDGALFNIDWSKYIKLRVVKNNYAPKKGDDFYMRFDETGNLEKVNVHYQRVEDLKMHFLFLLKQSGRKYTRRDLTKQPTGKEIYEQMVRAFPQAGLVRSRDIDLIIDSLLKDELIRKVPVKSGKRSHYILEVD